MALDVEKRHRSATTEKSLAVSEAEWAKEDVDRADGAGGVGSDGMDDIADVDEDADAVATWWSIDAGATLLT
jgi:hypothetical protein